MGACVSCKAGRDAELRQKAYKKSSLPFESAPGTDVTTTIAAVRDHSREGRPARTRTYDHDGVGYRSASERLSDASVDDKWSPARDTFSEPVTVISETSTATWRKTLSGAGSAAAAPPPERRGPFTCFGNKPAASALTPAQAAERAASLRHNAASISGARAPRVPCGQSGVTLSPSPTGDTPHSYCQAPPDAFKLRSATFLRSRQKAHPGDPIYCLIAADRFRTPHKHWHVARRMALPAVPVTAAMPDGRALDDANVPPLLVLHVMMPLYAATLFGKPDGPNCSIVYYLALPEGFDPATFHAPQALALLQRLAEPHPDPAAQLPIRRQIKMIARIADPDAWLASGSISGTEHRLLQNYNAKPVLMTPVTQFHRGRGYLEIDFDLHRFSYLAKKGLEGYIPRLGPAVWDHAFCVEGRTEGELPEALLGSARGIHWDFNTLTDFPAPLTDDPDPAAPS